MQKTNEFENPSKSARVETKLKWKIYISCEQPIWNENALKGRKSNSIVKPFDEIKRVFINASWKQIVKPCFQVNWVIPLKSWQTNSRWEKMIHISIGGISTYLPPNLARNYKSKLQITLAVNKVKNSKRVGPNKEQRHYYQFSYRVDFILCTYLLLFWFCASM